jgi:hypothetical protein
LFVDSVVLRATFIEERSRRCVAEDTPFVVAARAARTAKSRKKKVTSAEYIQKRLLENTCR